MKLDRSIIDAINHYMGEEMVSLFNNPDVTEIYTTEGSDFLFIAVKVGGLKPR